LEPYFRQDGIAYRIMPFYTSQHQRVDTDIMYDNLMNKYKWGNMQDSAVYMDENSIRMAKTFRILFGMLTEALANEGDSVRAKKALDYCLEVIPSHNVPYDFYSTGDLAKVYDKIGEKEQAAELYKALADDSFKNLDWYSRLNKEQYRSILDEVRKELYYLQFNLDFFAKYDKELYQKYTLAYEQHYQRFEDFMTRSRTRGGKNR
jgi:hypothetical protein